MSKRVLAYGLIAFLLLGLNTVYAEPVLNQVSGALSHGNTITINGAGFGSKSPAPPLSWDDCENKTVNNHSAVTSEGGYSEAWPYESTVDDYYKIQYRTIPFRNVTAAHQYSTKFLVGGHQHVSSTDHSGRDVMVTCDLGQGNSSDKWFAMWYIRLDPLWPPCGDECPNYKESVYQDTAFAYTGNHEYSGMIQYQGVCTRECGGGNKTCWNGRDHRNVRQHPNDYTNKFDGAACNNPAKGWVHFEQRINDVDGIYTILGDNEMSWEERNCPNCVSFPIRSFSIGGFYRKNGCSSAYETDNDAFRYYDDLYVDSTLSRVILANNSNYAEATIIEPQIPSAWSEDSITCTVNLGGLPASGKAYLFVFDADNNHNAKGYQVSINCAEEETAPEAPTGLRLVNFGF